MCLQPNLAHLASISTVCAGCLAVFVHVFGQQCSPPTYKLLPVIGHLCMQAAGCMLYVYLFSSSNITLCPCLALRNTHAACALTVTDKLPPTGMKAIKRLILSAIFSSSLRKSQINITHFT